MNEKIRKYPHPVLRSPTNRNFEKVFIV